MIDISGLAQWITNKINWAINIVMFWKDWDTIEQFMLFGIVFIIILFFRYMSKISKYHKERKKHNW